ncbi:hypothetical protein LCGC14_0369820 [marine sediment metagenome]|uniref:Uncharacterized protein n=1 Tax=marine sediment metagenome TaxID=412755 RepID=A0A0F9WE08_9ZZZZ
MVELTIVIFATEGIFYAQTDASNDPEEIIKGQGADPYEALEKWLEDLREKDFFRPD